MVFKVSPLTNRMQITEVTSPLEKSIGLIGKKNIKSGITFKTRFGIHTFFMREPIDVLLLDQNRNIVQLKENLAPWRIFYWGLQQFIVVELPRRSIKRRNLAAGQTFTAV